MGRQEEIWSKYKNWDGTYSVGAALPGTSLHGFIQSSEPEERCTSAFYFDGTFYRCDLPLGHEYEHKSTPQNLYADGGVQWLEQHSACMNSYFHNGVWVFCTMNHGDGSLANVNVLEESPDTVRIDQTHAGYAPGHSEMVTWGYSKIKAVIKKPQMDKPKTTLQEANILKAKAMLASGQVPPHIIPIMEGLMS